MLLLGLAAGALHARQLYAAVLLFIAFGLILALVWARLGAADLALAEAAIGAGLTGVLLQVLPIFVAYLIFAALLGRTLGSLFRLPVPSARTLTFSFGTRNSFVVPAHRPDTARGLASRRGGHRLPVAGRAVRHGGVPEMGVKQVDPGALSHIALAAPHPISRSKM